MSNALHPKLPLSGVVIACNEADRITRCVASLVAVCDEVLVLDSGSSDDTIKLAQAAGARVEHQPWLGFAEQQNAVIARARHPWVLLLHADEWLREGASEALRELFAAANGPAPIESADIWQLRRTTHFLGKALRFGGWGDEKIMRLMRNDVRFLPSQIHERVDKAGKRSQLSAIRVDHDTARSYPEYYQKLQRYAELWAGQNRARGKQAAAWSPLVHAFGYIVKNILLRGGILDGVQGWRYHYCHLCYVYRKYQLLRSAK